MKKYRAYKFTLRQHVDGGYSTHWRVRDPSTGYYYYHRVGGLAYVEYGPDSRAFAQTWDLEGREYHTGDGYQKALEAWLG